MYSTPKLKLWPVASVIGFVARFAGTPISVKLEPPTSIWMDERTRGLAPLFEIVATFGTVTGLEPKPIPPRLFLVTDSRTAGEEGIAVPVREIANNGTSGE